MPLKAAAWPPSPPPLSSSQHKHTYHHLPDQELVWLENYLTYKGILFSQVSVPIQFTVPPHKQLAEGRGQHIGRGKLGTTTFGDKASSECGLNGSIAFNVFLPARTHHWTIFINALLSNRCRISVGPWNAGFCSQTP